ncbi:ABC transporter substrate-binding protein [Ruania alba]|uniref:Extracellular solute-binding protein n=1 Tax=Ruania alba TaxID=648782 RepID=A0A1H5L2D9_9MICO|nr:sugar ABC transporter substrate-binding protein [Ruania alba]SEE71130.1 extracellular solute-binding protein [Ruania alba]
MLTTINPLLPQYEEYADAYMDTFPDRTVEVRGVSAEGAEYIQMLSTGRLSGEIPDVFFTGTAWINELSNEGITLDLSEGLSDGKLGETDADDFLSQFVDQYRPTDSPQEIHGLPVSADSVALFYNADLFEQAGVEELPQPDWTWDDMYRIAEEIQDATGGSVLGLAAPMSDGSPTGTYGPVVEAFGGYLYDPETNTTGIGQPEALEAWELLLSAYGTTSGDYAATPKDPVYDFQTGNIAMAIGSRATIPATQESLEGVEWDVQVVPTINGNSTTNGGSYGMSMAADSENLEAAWAFLEWFYDPEAGMEVAQQVGGAIPATEEGIDSGSWREVEPPPANIEIFAQTARDAVLLQPMPGSGAATLAEATKYAAQQVLLEGRSIEDAFGEAEQTVNEALAAEAD